MLVWCDRASCLLTLDPHTHTVPSITTTHHEKHEHGRPRPARGSRMVNGRGSSTGDAAVGRPRGAFAAPSPPTHWIAWRVAGRHHCLCNCGSTAWRMAATVMMWQPHPEGKVRRRHRRSRRPSRIGLSCSLPQRLRRPQHARSRDTHIQGHRHRDLPTCNSTHLLTDHLNWIEDDFRMEQFMAERGTRSNASFATTPPLTPPRVRSRSCCRSWARTARTRADAAEPSPDMPSKIDGISDDQALRIREAVRAAKRRKREEQ